VSEAPLAGRVALVTGAASEESSFETGETISGWYMSA
jgi:hypothetical protein